LLQVLHEVILGQYNCMSQANKYLQPPAQKRQEQRSSGKDGGAAQKIALAERSGCSRPYPNKTKGECCWAGCALCIWLRALGIGVELFPHVSKGVGLPFVSVLWLAAGEVAVPALGLSRPAMDYPLSSHFSVLAAHAVLGHHGTGAPRAA
jgi:hypothetical protein